MTERTALDEVDENITSSS